MIAKPCLLVLMLALGVIGCRAEPAATAAQANIVKSSVSGLDVIPLTIRTRAKRYDFRVEVARTSEQQAQGLMFRERMAPFAGMLFPMQPPRAANFWMHNTPEPLDLIFVRADGTIARIAVNAIPYSTDNIPSGEAVAAVLEIAGGRAAELGIEEGDRVTWTDAQTG